MDAAEPTSIPMPPRFTTCVIIAGAVLSTLAAAQSDTRPPFKPQRQDEDWSAFHAKFGQAQWLFDPFKHLALAESGEWWASFGGHGDVRTEAWNGFGFGAQTPGNSDAFTLSRVHLHGDFHFGEHLRAFVEARTAQSTDRKLPGGARETDLDTLDLYNAFVDVGASVGDGELRLRMGRQSLMYGSQRLISPLLWINAWRTFEGVHAQWRRGAWNVDAFLTALVVVDRFEPNERDDQKQLYGVYATRTPERGGTGLDLYLLGSTRPNVTINGTSGDERRHTAGLRTWGPWAAKGDFEFEGAWQFGDVDDEHVSAWFTSVVVGCKPGDSSAAPRVFAGLDAASGDRSPGGSVQTFHQLYPLGHAFLGLGDALGRQNIAAANLGCSVKLDVSTTATLTGHVFQLMDKDDGIYGVTGAQFRPGGFNSADVGQELDLLVQHTVTKFFSVYGGYSHIFAGKAIQEGATSEDQDFAYVGASFYF